MRRLPARSSQSRSPGSLKGARPGAAQTVLAARRLARPRLYQVLLHNDDYTTQEFVVFVLIKLFRHDPAAARRIMLHVHTQGIGVAGVYPFDEAETKAQQVMDFAREQEMPLRCSVRREDAGGDGKRAGEPP